MRLEVRNKADFVAVIVENQFSVMTLKHQNTNTPETLSFLYNKYNRWVNFKSRNKRKDVLRYSDFFLKKLYLIKKICNSYGFKYIIRAFYLPPIKMENLCLSMLS